MKIKTVPTNPKGYIVSNKDGRRYYIVSHPIVECGIISYLKDSNVSP